MEEHRMRPEFCVQVKSLESEFLQCRKLLNAVGDENRQHLLCAMLQEAIDGVRVVDLTQRTNLSRPAVSHHMQILKDAGIVKSRKEGTMIYYYLDPDDNQIRELKALVENLSELMLQLPDRSEEGMEKWRDNS